MLKKLQNANEQISKLQIKLNEAEEDAESRSSKVSLDIILTYQMHFFNFNNILFYLVMRSVSDIKKI